MFLVTGGNPRPPPLNDSPVITANDQRGVCWKFHTVPEKIHSHPMEGHQKSLGEGGLKSQNRSKEAKKQQNMKLNWNFLGGLGCKRKNLPCGEYGYFLERHINLFAD